MAEAALRFQNDDIFVDYQKNHSEVNSVSEQFVVEENRLEQSRVAETPWKKWGPYLTERQWGTVREDYSENGNAWDYFSHDQARSRAYRWGEDGLAGISDDQQFLCFALALWNGQDPILKERLFGAANARRIRVWQVADEIARRLCRIFLRGENGSRPVYGGSEKVPARPTLARPGAVLRILPRRQGRRHRRESSDRLDGVSRLVDQVASRRESR